MRQFVELGDALGPLRPHRGAHFGDGFAGGEIGEIVGGLRQRAAGEARRQRHDAVFDRPVLPHEDRHALRGVETDEFDVPEHHVGLGRDHHAGAVAEAAQQRGGLGEIVLDPRAMHLALDLPRNRAAVGFVHRADFKHGIDEKAQPLLRRLPPRRSVRRRDQPQIFEIGHDVAHAGGAEPDREHPAQIARADRRARFEIALDDLFEDVLAARIEHLQEIVGNLGHRRRNVQSNCDCNHLGKNAGR